MRWCEKTGPAWILKTTYRYQWLYRPYFILDIEKGICSSSQHEPVSHAPHLNEEIVDWKSWIVSLFK
jgi:hypothetical protein